MTDVPEAQVRPTEPANPAEPAEPAGGAGARALPGPAPAALDRTRAVAVRLTGGWPLARIIGVGVVVAALLSLTAIIVGGLALADGGSGSALDAAFIGVGVVLFLVVAVFALSLWRSVILPLSRLATDARQVAGGDFGHPVG